MDVVPHFNYVASELLFERLSPEEIRRIYALPSRELIDSGVNEALRNLGVYVDELAVQSPTGPNLRGCIAEVDRSLLGIVNISDTGALPHSETFFRRVHVEIGQRIRGVVAEVHGLFKEHGESAAYRGVTRSLAQLEGSLEEFSGELSPGQFRGLVASNRVITTLTGLEAMTPAYEGIRLLRFFNTFKSYVPGILSALLVGLTIADGVSFVYHLSQDYDLLGSVHPGLEA